MPLKLNRSGSSLLVVMAASVFVAIASVSIIKVMLTRQKAVTQLNVSSIANQIRGQVLSLVQNAATWQQTMIHSNGIFLNSNPTQPPLISLYYFPIPDGPAQIFLDATNNSQGFDPQGKPCPNFNSELGNDLCPFRYEVRYVSSAQITTIPGNPTVYTISFKLLYHPAHMNVVFNSNSSEYTFQIKQGFDSSSVQQTCVSLGGTINPGNGTCSVMMSFPQTCANGHQVMNGRPSTSPQNCVTPPINSNCPNGGVFPSCSVQGHGGT